MKNDGPVTAERHSDILAKIASFAKMALSRFPGSVPVPTRNINLTDHYHQFVENQVDSGRFKNASEVMRAGLRLLENEANEQDSKQAILKRLADEGFDDLDQGRGIELNSTESLSALVSEIGQRARKRASG
jgi:antitoxin ParD1/3/4